MGLNEKAKKKYEELNKAMYGLSDGTKQRLAKKLSGRMKRSRLQGEDILSYVKRFTNRYVRMYGMFVEVEVKDTDNGEKKENSSLGADNAGHGAVHPGDDGRS